MFKTKVHFYITLAFLLFAHTARANWNDSDESDNEVDTQYLRLPSCPNNDNPAYPTQLPHPTDCTKFYKCDRGVPVIQNCPAGLHWSAILNQCDWPSIAGCQNPWKPPINDGSDEDEDYDHSRDIAHDYLCYNKISDLLPHPTYCRKFIQCSHGFAHTFNCTAGLYWNDDIKKCDYLYNVNCPNYSFDYPSFENFRVFRKIQQDDKPIRDYRCPLNENPAKPTHLPYPDNCSKFYKCDRGFAYPLDCPAGLHWNSRENVCDWPQVANCY